MPTTRRVHRALATVTAALVAAVGFALVPATTAHADSVTVDVGFRPWEVAISPDGSTVYVSDRDNWEVARVDIATRTVIDTIPVTVPKSIVFSPDGSRAYVGEDTVPSQISIIDTATGTVTSPPAFEGGNGMSRMAISPNGNLLVVTYPNDEVRIFNTNTLALVATLPTGDGPAGVQITSDNGTAYLINNAAGTFQLIDLAATPPTISVEYPATIASDLAIAPDDSALFTNTYQAASRINPGTPPTFTESALPIPGSSTRDLVFDPVGSGDILYVVDNTNDAVVAVDVATASIVATFPTGDAPFFLDHSRTSQVLAVANFGAASTTITLIELAQPTLDGAVPAAYAGTAFSFIPTSEGYPDPAFSISAGALPPGLTLDPVTGEISGTPTIAGVYGFTVLAQNYLGTASIDRQIIVQAASAAPSPEPTPSKPSLPATGSDVSPALALAALALLVAGLTMSAIRRRSA